MKSVASPPASPPTIRDVARLAGVSVGAVSRALKNQSGIGEDTRLRVMQKAEQLGYDLGNLKRTKLRRASFLMHRRHSTLMNNPFYSEVLHGAESACRESGITLSFGSVTAEDGLEDVLRRQESDALLLVGYFEQELLERVAAIRTPTVLIDFWAPQCATVNTDNFGGSYQMTQHLIRAGRRRIAFMAGPLTHFSIAQRQLGYRQAHWHSGLSLDPALELSRDPLEHEDGAYRSMMVLLEHSAPPDAVVCYNDLTAERVMRACSDAGLNVPGDVSVVGFDDVRAAALLQPPLSTVWVDKEEMGRQGVRALLDLQQGLEVGHRVVPIKLILRSSG